VSSTSDADLARLLDDCRRIARLAGVEILSVAREDPCIRNKADGSPVTRADLASNRVIASFLAGLSPSMPVLSEEGGVTPEALAGAERFWLVDPLDGTKEFIKGTPEYTVNIALIEGDAPVLGVVYAPALDTMWYAARGGGAFKQAGTAAARRVSPSTRAAPSSAVVSRSHLSEATVRFLDANGIAESVSHGSSIKICAVAEGAADVYPRHGPTNIWDTAAGAAVAREAGCRVVDLAGDDLRYGTAAGTRREGFVVYPAGMRVVL
jgi:3'(2'), 5'-bisphosphate nucleotidase